MLTRLIFIAVAAAIGLGSYVFSTQKNPLDQFLASTPELVASGDLDPDLFERFMRSPDDPNVSDFMLQVSAQYLGHIAVELRNTRGHDFMGVAINEPYDPEIDAVWIYIVDGYHQRFSDLPLQCNAIAYPDRGVVLIDTALLDSISKAEMCSEGVEPARIWIDDPSSIVAGTASLFGSDWRNYFSQVPFDAWRMFGNAIPEIDYRGRAMLPLLIVGHELGHISLHREEHGTIKRIFSGGPDIAIHMEREIEADNFAVETLIMALADQDLTTLDAALAAPNTWHIEVLAANQAVQEKLRFFALVMSGFEPNEIIPDLQLVDEDGAVLRARPEGVQIVDLACDPQLIYARRIVGLAVTFGHYNWRVAVEAANQGDTRFHPELTEDEYYLNMRDQLSEQIIECDLNDLY